MMHAVSGGPLVLWFAVIYGSIVTIVPCYMSDWGHTSVHLEFPLLTTTTEYQW